MGHFNWPLTPLNDALKHKVCDELKTNTPFKEIYGSLFKAYERADSGHYWEGSPGEKNNLPSWSEYRRQSILRRVIDSCEAFGVELLVLPEYSVRPETIEWLSDHLKNRKVSVLAGTYLNLEGEHQKDHLSANLTLLWPLPKSVSDIIIGKIEGTSGSEKVKLDELKRGTVLKISRNKKYRSIALEEFFRPESGVIEPLFVLKKLVKATEAEISHQLGFEYRLSSEIVTELLTGTKLPLKHLLELICSEIFLVSSPANYGQMAEDYIAMRRRFGEPGDKDEVFNDLKNLSNYLSITGDEPRRSVLAVPAATSRSADYWIAGQAGFLAAGTATVFCNSVGEKALVGGSCFIGSGSWKSADKATGYISKITPYHGWSKGIYFNDRKDALSEKDRAVVIVDIDPENMMEGKPRAQTLPPPLQLVAYLPLIETANWQKNDHNLVKSLRLPTSIVSGTDSTKRKAEVNDRNRFWNTVFEVNKEPTKRLKLWEYFPDKTPLIERANVFYNNSNMQPSCPIGAKELLASPSTYDWIEIDLTLPDYQSLPKINVPPWKV